MILVKAKRRVRYFNISKIKQSSTNKWNGIDFRVVNTPLWSIGETKMVDGHTSITV